MPLLTKNRLLWLAGLSLSVFTYARWVEPRWLAVREVRLKLPRLPEAFHDYRIVHLSDLHLGWGLDRSRLQGAVDLVNLIQPDLVAITGDFIDRTAGEVIDDLIGPLRQLQSRDATVAVMGNHDYYHGVNGVRRALKASGILDVSNRVHTLERDGALLHIAGVDDVAWHHDSLDAVLDALPDSGPALLLAHEPDFADLSAATGRFDLQLSGHSHGGQVRLPLIGMPVLPSHGQRYPSGWYQVGDMQLYTNRGLGTIAPHIRLGARPELTVLMLESAARG
ncbi:MAG: metallophosphoesterase [Anaerolineae bacterium]|nr:metallophosphoesterase [Anaerolineae bacterium]